MSAPALARRAPSPEKLLTVAAILAGVYLLVALALAIGNAIANGTDFSGYAADGPFQLYNPLRRLAAGEVVGRDFPFFHGPGVVLIHYPLFALFGGNVFAAEMSRWLVSPALFYASGFVFLLALLRKWKLALVALVLYAALVMPMDRMIEPSNSLLGVRTTLPLLVAAALLWRPKRFRMIGGFVRVDAGLVLAIVTAGASVSFGTEQGVACCIAFVIVRLVTSWRELRSAWRALARTAVEAVAVLIAVLSWSSILTLGNAPAALGYALGSIPLDQGWVFGSPPNTALTWGALYGQLVDLGGRPPVALYVLYVVLAVVLLALAVRRRAIAAHAWQGAGLLLLYGAGVIASIIGYVYLVDQVAPLARMAAIVAAGAATALVFAPAPEQTRLRRPALVATAALAVAAVLTAGVGAAAQVRTGLGLPLATAARLAVAAPGQTDEQLLGPGWAESLAEFAPYLAGSPTIWSTYTGLYESTTDQIGAQPGGEDYIIHALGPERRDAYSAGFAAQHPDVAITMNPSYFGYEEWLWSKYPDFYVALLSDYRLVATNAPHKLWKYDSDSIGGLGAAEPADFTTESIILPANTTSRVQLWVIDLEYSAGSLGGPLDRLPRYLLAPSDTALSLDLSLPWYETSWRVIVPVLPGQQSPRLDTATTGIVPAHLTVDSATIRELTPASDAGLRLFEQAHCLNLGEPTPGSCD